MGTGGPGLDWPGLMRAGLRGLGLEPRAFWALTPAELALMLGEGAGGAPLGRARLEELAARWPDRPGPVPAPSRGGGCGAAAFAARGRQDDTGASLGSGVTGSAGADGKDAG